MTADTPTLDRLVAASLRIAAERQFELISPGSPDEVAELAWRSVQAAVPRVDLDAGPNDERLNTIVDAFSELGRIVMTSDLDPLQVRTIIAAEAIRTSRTDFYAHQMLVQEAAKVDDLDSFLANLHGGFEAFRYSILFFLANVPGGALDAAASLVLGLTDEDWDS